MFPNHRMYWMCRGLSRPKFARIWSTVSCETTGFRRISARKSPGESWVMREERSGGRRLSWRPAPVASVLPKNLLVVHRVDRPDRPRQPDRGDVAQRVTHRGLGLRVAEVVDGHLLGDDLLPAQVELLALLLADLTLGL